ncbi:MAG: histidine kinase [Burkholderiaceae bacterium]|nr:histidine kinase [Burkholderiaceae bacterium]
MTPEILPTTYVNWLVVASFVVSALGAYVALTAARFMRDRRGRVSRLNALLAGVALGGVGIWSMHFLGMLAWDAGLALGYRLGETLLSLLIAVGVSALALGYMAAGSFTARRVLVAGPLAGLGVAAMHFIGMASVRFGGFLQWDAGLVALAVGIAVVAATAALWLAFGPGQRIPRTASALVMAAAVCTMHYTGMAAADVVCTTADRAAKIPGLLYGDELAMLVVAVALSAAVVIAADLMVQRFTRAAAVR